MFYFCFSLSWVSFLQKGERDRTVYIINLLKQNQVTALRHTYQQLPLVYYKECFALASAVKGLSYTGYFPVHWPDGYAKLMSPNKDEITVHGCHCPGDMVVRMRKVLAIPWSWYVCFSAFTWYCYHSFACLDCLFCRWCNSKKSTGPFPYLHLWLWERLRKLSMFTSHDYIRSHFSLNLSGSPICFWPSL